MSFKRHSHGSFNIHSFAIRLRLHNNFDIIKFNLSWSRFDSDFSIHFTITMKFVFPCYRKYYVDVVFLALPMPFHSPPFIHCKPKSLPANQTTLRKTFM